MNQKQVKNRWLIAIEDYTKIIHRELSKLNIDDAWVIVEQYKLIFYDTFKTYYFSRTFESVGAKSFAHSYVSNLSLILESAKAIDALEYVWEHLSDFLNFMEMELVDYQHFEAAHNIKTIHDFFRLYFKMNDEEGILTIYIDDQE